jgi:hypothetical protein
MEMHTSEVKREKRDYTNAVAVAQWISPRVEVQLGHILNNFLLSIIKNRIINKTASTYDSNS